MLIINGCFFGIRGNEEHSLLTISNVIHGQFEIGHSLQGLSFIGYDKLQDKSHKLSVTNSWVRDTKNSMRLPIFPDNPNSPGTIMWEFITTRLSPAQERLICKPATSAQRCHFIDKGFLTSWYSPNEPIGKNTIAKMFKEIGETLGLPDNFSGHALRRECISTMVNKHVPLTETMATARHSSVAAHASYIKRTGESEMIKFQAFGLA